MILALVALASFGIGGVVCYAVIIASLMSAFSHR